MSPPLFTLSNAPTPPAVPSLANLPIASDPLTQLSDFFLVFLERVQFAFDAPFREIFRTIYTSSNLVSRSEEPLREDQPEQDLLEEEEYTSRSPPHLSVRTTPSTISVPTRRAFSNVLNLLNPRPSTPPSSSAPLVEPPKKYVLSPYGPYDATPLDQEDFRLFEAAWYPSQLRDPWEPCHSLVSMAETRLSRTACIFDELEHQTSVSPFLVANGLDKQKFKTLNATDQLALRLKRRAHLQHQLDQTRPFARRRVESRGQAEKGANAACLARDAMVRHHHTYGNHKKVFSLRISHMGCEPSFDHFQLKRLVHVTSNRHIHYIEQVGDLRDILRLSSCVFQYDKVTQRKRAVLGPWKFGFIHTQPDVTVSPESSCLHTMAASKSYVAAADSASGLLFGKFRHPGQPFGPDDPPLEWMFCQPVSSERRQITNFIQIIEEDFGDQFSAALCNSMISQMAERKSLFRQDRAEALLAVIERHLNSDKRLLLLGLHALRADPSVEEQTQTTVITEPLWRRFLQNSNNIQLVRFTVTTYQRRLSESPSAERESPQPAPPSHEPSPLRRRGRSRWSDSETLAAAQTIRCEMGGSHDPNRPRCRPRWRQHPETLMASGAMPRAVMAACDGLSDDTVAEIRHRASQPAFFNSRVTVITASNDASVVEWKLVPMTAARSIDDTWVVLPNGGFGTHLVWRDTPSSWGLEPVTSWRMPFPINQVAVHPSQDLLLLVGDNPAAMIFSRRIGSVLEHGYSQPLLVLDGHQDCGFAAAWHPNGVMLATGNDDETVAFWDIRYPKAPMKVLPTMTTSVRSLRFTPDGNYLISAESEDVVMIYGVRDNIEPLQGIPFYGGCTGIDLADNGETLFIGVAANQSHGTVLEYSRRWSDEF